MKIGHALRAVQLLYLDAAPLIYYVETHPAYGPIMDAVIAAVERTPITVVTSVITLTEVLSQPMKVGNTRLEREYRDILSRSGGFHLLPVTPPIAESAAALRARYNLRTPDALHVATALATGCDVFLTNDAVIARITALRVLSLGEMEPEPPPE